MKKWMIRILSVLLIAAFLPMNVLAAEYDLSEGSVTVSTSKRADGSTKQEVTHKNDTKEDSNPTISSKGQQPDNTVTIKADAGTTANVTIKDTNIDSNGTGKAAIKTEGKGDVNLNVEGTNRASSDFNHAGVEKSNEGNLTIGSKSGSGELTANGGTNAAGIGSGFNGAGVDVRDITITGGEITANGGDGAAGIGGGTQGDARNISISGGKVTASGGVIGAGIGGGGIYGVGDNVTISGNAQVIATGGDGNSVLEGGAAIGSGGSVGWVGTEVPPDTSGLYTTGKVERKRGDGTVLDTITGTVEPPVEPEKSASSEEEPVKREPLYRVLNLDGSSLKHQAETTDGILALTAEADGAILTGTLRALGYLQNQGVEKITFTDGTHNAELVLADLIAKGQPEDIYVLTLGAENTLTLNGEAINF